MGSQRSSSSSFFGKSLLAATVCSILVASNASAATLQSAQDALSKGDIATAAQIYDDLSREGESLAAELGIIRTALQDGEFRKAVAHANQTAGEHPDSTDAAAILAFLLDRSGRTEQALSSLQALERERPQDWMAVVAHAEILIDRLDARQALALTDRSLKALQPNQPPELLRLSARARNAIGLESVASSRHSSIQRASIQSTWIAATAQRIPVTAQQIAAAGNGVVIDQGTAVLTDASLFKGSQGKAWVRNGVGKVRAARIDAASRESANVVRLILQEPFPASGSISPTQIAGPEGTRFCFVFAFGAPVDLDPAFASISPGMVMRADTGIGGLMQITTVLGAGHNGAAVFDPRGRLLGMAIASGERVLVGTEDVRKALGNGSFAFRVDRLLADAKTQVATGPQPPMPSVEELYERLAPAIVQVIALK